MRKRSRVPCRPFPARVYEPAHRGHKAMSSAFTTLRLASSRRSASACTSSGGLLLSPCDGIFTSKATLTPFFSSFQHRVCTLVLYTELKELAEVGAVWRRTWSMTFLMAPCPGCPAFGGCQHAIRECCH